MVEERQKLQKNISDEDIDLIEIVKPIFKNLKLIFLLPIMGSMIFAIVFYFFAPRNYMSSAELVVISSKIENEFQEDKLNVQFYKTIIQSSALIAKLQATAVQKGFIKKNMRLELGNNLQVKVFTRKRAEEIAITPIIRLGVFAESPNTAFNLLSLWIEIFNEDVEGIRTKTKGGAITFIESEFPKKSAEYEKTLKEYEALVNKTSKIINNKEEQIDEELNSFDSETKSLINNLKSDRRSERLELEFSRMSIQKEYLIQRSELKNRMIQELNPEMVAGKYDNLKEKFIEFSSNLKVIDVNIGEVEQAVTKLKELLVGISPKKVFETHRFIFKTSEEKENTNYASLEDKIQAHEESLALLKSKKENILKNIEQIKIDYEDLREKKNENQKLMDEFDYETKSKTEILENETNLVLEKFDNDTELMIFNLNNKREFKRKKLSNRLDEDLSEIKSKQNVDLFALSNRKTYLGSVYKGLAEKYEKVSLSKAEEDLPVKVAVTPYVPTHSEPRNTIKKTLIFGILLGFAILCFVYMKELYEKYKEELY